MKEKKPVAEYVLSSVKMYLMTLLFSLFAMLFLIDFFPAWSRIIMGIVFMLPQLASHYLSGKKQGESAFRRNKRTAGKSNKVLPLPKYYRAIFHVLLFAVPLIILLCLSLIIKNLTLRAMVIVVFFMPVTLIFWGMGALNLDVINYVSAVVFIPAILLYCGAFIFGYIQSQMMLRRREGEIRGELRSFNN